MNLKTLLITISLVLIIFLNGCECNVEKRKKPVVKPESKITIAAASDLKYAMDSLVSAFKRIHAGIAVHVIYGSSGKFYEQIIRDAPFDLYFSADAEYPRKLDSIGLTADDPTIYAIGRIVIYSKKLNTKNGMNVLMDSSIRKIAIANPSHAPYGKRAEEALRYYKLYDRLEGKLIMGENIAQAAQYVSTGAAEVGIIAQSLALGGPLQQMGNYYLIPEGSHNLLQQAFVLLKKAEKNTSAFTFSDFISSPQAKKILTDYGFSIPQ